MEQDQSLENEKKIIIGLQIRKDYRQQDDQPEPIADRPIQIKYKRTRHRLTNSDFLARYHRVLKPDGIIHLKTDSEFMYSYTLGILQAQGHPISYANHDVYHSTQDLGLVTSVQIFYERAYLEQDKPITYIAFKLRF